MSDLIDNNMEMHTIRICNEDEKDKLIDFIRCCWKEDHILTKSEELLNFQHLDKVNKIYNFIVAFNNETGAFDAILGFIPLNKYDQNVENDNIWLAVWKVKKEYANLLIGIKLLLNLTNMYNSSDIGVIGISDDAMEIYKAFKYKTGSLEHFIIKNENMEYFHIAKFPSDTTVNTTLKKNNIHLKEISRIEFEKSNLKSGFKPSKTIQYFVKRYIEHPFYKYRFFGFYLNGEIAGVFISRIITVDESKCLRIVDWIGKFPDNVYHQFQELLANLDCEYVDLLCHVADIQQVLKMGFSLKNEADMIIPEYFEPFVRKNTDIRFAYKSNDDHYSFFKGDGDQDRPNII